MKKRILFFLTFIVIILAITGLCFYNDILWFNNPSEKNYPVKGVDVSSYQGVIHWEVLSKENIDFTFIKATEGSSFQDDNFKYNFENSLKTDLKVGAYHFFSYDSSGETQAENFIKTVPKKDGTLPPVIDIEFYGNLEQNPPSKEHTQKILTPLIEELESHYGKKPIIYCTKKSYELYIKGSYEDCPIWYRSIFTKPSISDNRKWTFWQYSEREKLKGYNGAEKYIDMNVFDGNMEDLNELTK